MELFVEQFDQYARGAYYTVLLTLGGAALAFVLAMAFGILGTMRSRLARMVSAVYVETFRGVSALVLMVWMAFVVPRLTGYALDELIAAVIAVGINVGAYGAEVVRAAINAVPKAQVEATVALNMTPFQRMSLVVLPQAWAQMLPTFGNLVIELMKATAVAFLIGVVELTAVAKSIRDATGETFAAFAGALIFYYLFAHVLLFGLRLLERRASRKLGRTPPSGTGLLGLLRSPKVPTTTGGGI